MCGVPRVCAASASSATTAAQPPAASPHPSTRQPPPLPRRSWLVRRLVPEPLRRLDLGDRRHQLLPTSPDNLASQQLGPLAQRAARPVQAHLHCGHRAIPSAGRSRAPAGRRRSAGIPPAAGRATAEAAPRSALREAPSPAPAARGRRRPPPWRSRFSSRAAIRVAVRNTQPPGHAPGRGAPAGGERLGRGLVCHVPPAGRHRQHRPPHQPAMCAKHRLYLRRGRDPPNSRLGGSTLKSPRPCERFHRRSGYGPPGSAQSAANA